MKNIHIKDNLSFMTTLEVSSDDPSVVADLVKYELNNFKVVKLKNNYHIADLRSFYNKITEHLGKPVNIGEDFTKGGLQTGERWLEIRYDMDVPDLDAYRHSKNAQPLHTDESYITDPVDILVFYCVNRAKLGGQTVFVDSLQLVSLLKEVDEDLLNQLSSTKVTYKKANNSRTEFIIDLSNPSNPLVNYNYYCIDPNESDFNKTLNKRFFDFLLMYVRGTHIEVPVQLEPGESVFWWDHYLLHGRNSFLVEKTNDRFIWKTGVKWIEN